jgi:hypothetical protein
MAILSTVPANEQARIYLPQFGRPVDNPDSGSDIEMQGLERRGLKGTGCGCACVIDWAIVGCGS